MNLIVIYDIQRNTMRNQISECIKDYGLKRIQKSAFMGYLKKYEISSLIYDLDKISIQDSIIIFPICSEDFNNIKILGRKLIMEYDNNVKIY